MSFKKYLALNASAGTGKTFRLTTRFISIMLKGEKPENIVALTFTNKASNEMKERILKILKNPEENTDEINFIAKELKEDPKEIMKKIKKLPTILQLNISTIDSFLSNILKSFASFAGINQDFSPGNVSEKKEMSEFFKFLKRKNETKKLVDFANATNKTVDSIVEDLKIMNAKEKEVEVFFSNLVLEKQGQKNKVEERKIEVFDILKKMKNLAIERNGTKTAINSFEAKNIADLMSKKYIERETLNYRTFSKIYDDDLDFLFRKLKESLAKYYEEEENYFLNQIFSRELWYFLVH